VLMRPSYRHLVAVRKKCLTAEDAEVSLLFVPLFLCVFCGESSCSS
jgi:hypothetical protein